MKPYPNPPIKEALVDIKISPLPTSHLDLLGALHEEIRERYPEKKAQHRWESAMKIQDDRLVSATQRHLGPIGFLFSSYGKEQNVQYRLDGFTFNQLHPYPREGWPVFQEEAKRLWSLYLNAIKPDQVDRIGLRYINQIDIPFPRIDLNEYLVEPPRIPKELPQTQEHFLTRVIIPFPELEAKATITQSLTRPPSPLTTSLILDIGIFTEVAIKSDTPKVWEVLNRFRDVKNMIFKSSIRPKTEELFQ